jgi:acetyl-CoA synthetase
MVAIENRVRELLGRFTPAEARVAQLLCDNHPPGDIAFTVVGADLSCRDLTFGELTERSSRFANGLARLGVGPGRHVATLMGKSVDLVTAVLAIWRLGAVHVPLFTAFVPPAIAMRLEASRSLVVVADADQRAKLTAIAPGPVAPPRVIVSGGGGVADDLDVDEVLRHEALAPDAVAAVGPGAAIVRLYTSGTTGRPKGVDVPVRALASLVAYLELGLDVRPDDVYCNAADPGWAYGIYYAILAPLALGRRSVLLSAPFSADLTWRVIEQFGVTNFAAAPTTYRALRAATAPPRTALRCCASAGEPLDPDTISWAQREIGVAIHDHYGQTELGMVVMNANSPDLARELRPGSMGHPAPGWDVRILWPDRDEPAPSGTPGRVAVGVTGSPFLWFDRYADDPERTRERFSDAGAWYLTGDVGRVDDHGYLYFSARDDDVIIMAGYRIGPFEVEAAIVEHPAIAKAAIIGVPDQLRGEVIEAFVVLAPGVAEPPALFDEVRSLVKSRFAAHAYPRRIHVVDMLPKTPSGKVKRFELRASRSARSSG